MKKQLHLFEVLRLIILLSLILVSCQEEPVLPHLTTTATTAITYRTATSGGNIVSDGGSSVSRRGVCWGLTSNPTIDDSKTNDGAGMGAFTSSITGLTPNTTYFLRSYAINEVGTAYGNQIEFTTVQASSPQLSTSSVIDIAYTTAFSGGDVSSDGGEDITARGVCWSTNPNPTIFVSKTTDGISTGIFSSNLTGLTAGTTYYVRAYATNSIGTGYGNEIEFVTVPVSITDIDGNVYHTVIIAYQVWLVENLKTTRYRNGDPISSVSGASDWANLVTGAYSFYSNSSSNYTTYGNLYNWFAINDSRNIAPVGWHVPSEAEWTTLQDYLGGELNAGGKLKETGLDHWESPNDGATNETGFTALPGGYRFTDGSFSNLGFKGVWWSNSEKSSNSAYALFTYAEGTQLHGEPNEKRIGFSIRCIMD